MKRAREILSYCVVLAVLLLVSQALRAQDKKKKLAEKIANKEFVFKARTVTPTSGRFRQLTSEYDLRVSGDSVVCYLPYFGRAYSAPINPSEGGLKFTSVDFEYKYAPRKKGWDVTINPKDGNGVQELSMTIFENGNASLRVSSTNRQLITFNGYVEK